ncbi:MAG TPA: PIG-L family deacetylase [Tepidisphaeraceae bacterium]|jgi:bacillithiol biosynthesis deacetylase BshB1|nr:PIG-L family deacetylase [Tepidisphaeraceae bacterium]
MASILVIGPHPDDQELGMGGSIARLAAQGHRVHLIDMTNGEPTPLGTPEKRASEAAAAAKILGVQRTLLGFPNRQVVHSIEARHKVAAVIRLHRPNWLFLPFPIDAHPDHVAVTKIGEDARFDAKLTKSDIPGDPWHPKRIIYYYCTHLRMNFQPTFCLDISDQMETKLAAMRAYESQMIANNSPVPEMVRTLCGYFGGRIGTAYAEPFFTYEALGFGGLDQLI